MIKFSVIVPVYNASNTIERCVESIIANKFQDMEVILIDDCSKDDSLKKCIELSEKYSSVRYCHNEVNKGVSFTRNRGLDEAKGTYIMFVDSDDWIDSNYFANFDGVVDNYGSLFSICGYVNHDEMVSGRVDNIGWDNFEGCRTFTLKNELKNIYDRTLLQQLWNKVFITKIVRDNNLRFDESISIGEDLRFILQYIKVSNIDEVVLINQPLYHYMRDQKDSLMYKVGTESVDEPLKNLRTLYEILGYDEDEIKGKLESDRENQIALYAYMILHNQGMPLKNRKKLVLALDKKRGKELYKHNRNVYIKEKIAKLLKK